ncbi:MAG: hypothetical protein HN741_06775 [Anaerolineae bacterium]|jgi:hypothetical protein|nr:hypothetical protein [Anaerolineae bacterium]
MNKANIEKLLEKKFSSLERKFAFKKIESEHYEDGLIITYQNPTTEVLLNYQIGEFPWIMIADIKNPKKDRVSLDWLLVELGEREAPTTDDAFFPEKMAESQLEAELEKKKEQLLSFGIEMLKGDFALLPKLQERANDYLAECKKFANRHKISA